MGRLAHISRHIALVLFLIALLRGMEVFAQTPGADLSCNDPTLIASIEGKTNADVYAQIIRDGQGQFPNVIDLARKALSNKLYENAGKYTARVEWCLRAYLALGLYEDNANEQGCSCPQGPCKQAITNEGCKQALQVMKEAYRKAPEQFGPITAKVIGYYRDKPEFFMLAGEIFEEVRKELMCWKPRVWQGDECVCKAPNVLKNGQCTRPLRCKSPSVKENGQCVCKEPFVMKDGACVSPPQCSAPSILENGECVCKPPSTLEGDVCICKPPRYMQNGACFKLSLIVQIKEINITPIGISIKGVATPGRKVQIWLDGHPMTLVSANQAGAWEAFIPIKEAARIIRKPDNYLVEAHVLDESDGELPSLDYRWLTIESEEPVSSESRLEYGGMVAIRGLLEANFPLVHEVGLSFELNRRLGDTPLRLGVAVLGRGPKMTEWLLDLRARADLAYVQPYLLSGAGRDLRYGMTPRKEFVPFILRAGGGISFAFEPGPSIWGTPLRLEAGVEACQEWQLPRGWRSLEWTGFMGTSM